MMKASKCFLCLTANLLCLQAPDSIQAFGNPPPFRKTPNNPIITTANRAIIYGGDDSDSIKYVEEEEQFSQKAPSFPIEWIESLAARCPPEWLVRIACAMAPPPHNHLHPSDAVSAHLVNVYETGAEIALGVSTGEDGGAVTILVPISFDGTPCDTEDKAILQLARLDARAQNSILEQEQSSSQASSFGEQLQRRRLIQELQEEPANLDLPDWWTWPELNRMLDDECALLKSMLNEEDFASDIATLFQQNYHHDKPEEVVLVIKACVGSVGPFGILMRAYCEIQNDDDGSTCFGVKELALQFDKEVKSRDMMRSSVLKLIDSAEGQQQQQQQQITTEVLVAQEPLEEDHRISKKKEAFQRSLLNARYQYEELANQKVQAKKIQSSDTIQTTSSNERPQNTPSTTIEVFQRELLKTRLQYERLIQKKKADELFHRRLLSATLATAKSSSSPKQQQQENSKRYGDIEDIGERAFAILKDLGMV